jgi:hypothetical protein
MLEHAGAFRLWVVRDLENFRAHMGLGLVY